MFQYIPQESPAYAYMRLLNPYSGVYAAFDLKPAYIEMCANDKYFWSFPHMSPNILTLGLPYSLNTLRINPPLPLWSAI